RGSFGEIDGCTVERCRQIGLEVRNGGSLIVNNCDIKNNQTHGLTIGSLAEYCRVTRSAIHHNQLEGILFTLSTIAEIKNNTIFHNGMRGISTDGGIITIQGNKIFENWFWGISLKTRTSGNVQNNEIFSNKCGGIRVGTNYSARILIDSNTIRDHPGPALHTEVLRPETERLLKDTSTQSKIQKGMPQDEVTLYISPPMVTDRNIIRKNGVGKLLKTNPLEICANCHSKGDMQKCSKCRKTQYCGKACQKQHWNKHKRICKIISGE
ncbi:unnamed protein product, partial [Owenia fusiformis]